MNAKERKYLEDVWADCCGCKRRGELTEFGCGQMVLAGILLGKRMQNF